MNRSIFWSELRQNRTYTIIWIIVSVVSTGGNVGGGAAAEGAGPGYDILVVFAQGVVNLVMLGAIFAMILGGLVMSREEDEKTIEFLLSHPVTRLEIAMSKLAAFVVLVALFNVVLLIADVVLLEIFKSPSGYDFSAFFGIWLSEVVLTFFFGAAGMLFSAFVTKGGAVVGACIGIPIIAMVLSALGNTGNTLLGLLSYVSPFRYLDVAAIMSRGSAQPGYVMAFLTITAALLAASFSLYQRREFAV
jgi:ABC-2 type transport system permease protein